MPAQMSNEGTLCSRDVGGTWTRAPQCVFRVDVGRRFVEGKERLVLHSGSRC